MKVRKKVFFSRKKFNGKLAERKCGGHPIGKLVFGTCMRVVLI